MTDKTKQRIQELLPEVKELKFGCEVEWKSPFTNYKLARGFVARTDKYQAEVVRHKEFTMHTLNSGHYEILGSPITLAIVLRALIPQDIAVDNEGLLYNYSAGFMSDPKAKWNLTKDNYDDQSEECRAFIGSLLGVKL